MELAARWAGLVARWGAPEEDVSRLGSALVGRYAEPHRRYHTVAHLEAVADALFLDLAADPVCVELAAFFHDAVYDPRAPRGANESASAALAEADLRSLGAPGTSTEAGGITMSDCCWPSAAFMTSRERSARRCGRWRSENTTGVKCNHRVGV